MSNDYRILVNVAGMVSLHSRACPIRDVRHNFWFCWFGCIATKKISSNYNLFIFNRFCCIDHNVRAGERSRDLPAIAFATGATNDATSANDTSGRGDGVGSATTPDPRRHGSDVAQRHSETGGATGGADARLHDWKPASATCNHDDATWSGTETDWSRRLDAAAQSG